MLGFRKIVGAVSESSCLRKSERKDKGDITEPVAFAGSIISHEVWGLGENLFFNLNLVY